MSSTKVRPESLLDGDVGSFGVYQKKTRILAKQINEPFEVETLEGTMKGNPGDYLAMGAKGEFYPIKKEIFEETYEKVSE